MAKEIMREVTQVFHDAGGHAVLYGPGDRFALDADLPDWVTTRDVVVDVPDKPAARAAAAKAEAPEGKVAAHK